MKVELAGYNIDEVMINDDGTPETIAAAYARVSRDPRDIFELRMEAIEKIEKARKSCETIVYDYGHSAIAETAVFNIDIMDVSRLVVETIQHSRLCSFIEKSYRYQKVDGQYIIPEELDKSFLRSSFISCIKEQVEVYHKIYDAILENLKEKNSGIKKAILKNIAKEDARYVTPLALTTQMGMTINARNLPKMIKRLRECGLREGIILGDMLYERTASIVPSLIKYCDTQQGHHLLNRNFKGNFGITVEEGTSHIDRNVQLQYYTPSSDERLAAVIAYDKCVTFQKVNGITSKELIDSELEKLGEYDPVPRSFEAIDFAFTISCSASAFAQIKRHRMAMLIKKPYYRFCFIVPQTVIDAGMKNLFIETCEESCLLSRSIEEKHGILLSEYILPQSAKRSILLKMNARELYHFAKLRCREDAQWEIREIANKMVEQVKQVAPFAFAGLK